MIEFAHTPSGIRLFVRDGAYLSLFNSPYPAHRFGTAVDIYDDNASFPAVKGRIWSILTYPSPLHRPDASDKEPITIIDLDNGLVLKILHVQPSLDEGDEVSLGDSLGNPITSGYLCPWSDPHMHVEVRPSEDPLRVRGAERIYLSESFIARLKDLGCSESSVAEVVEVHGSYVLLELKDGLLCGTVNGYSYIIDGGFPHYGYAALIGYPLPRLGDVVKTPWGDSIGLVTDIGDFFSLITPISYPVINSYPFFGVGTYLGRRFFKLVMREGTASSFEVGDRVRFGFRVP